MKLINLKQLRKDYSRQNYNMKVCLFSLFFAITFRTTPVFSRFINKKAGVTRNVVIDKNGTIVYLTRQYNTEEFEGIYIQFHPYFLQNL